MQVLKQPMEIGVTSMVLSGVGQTTSLTIGFIPLVLTKKEKVLKPSKTQKVLHHLKSGKSISPLEALGLYGSFRLAAVVHSLKKRGYDIITDIKTDMNGSRYAQYTMSDRDNNQLELSF